MMISCERYYTNIKRKYYFIDWRVKKVPPKEGMLEMNLEGRRRGRGF